MARYLYPHLILALLLLPLIAGCSQESATAGGDSPSQITLDYAYYSPISLVVKHFGWLEEEFVDDGTEINWVLSLGSNKANEYSQSGTAHFASTAGVAGLLARANGVPIKTVYIYSKPEWTALVAATEASIESVADLRGRKVAATRGTDPFFFLLQALASADVSASDVEIVHLQHGEGKTALDRGDVDAWAGLDPYMAQGELEGTSELFFREPDFNTYGFLNALEAFITQYPEATQRVIATYERGRQWILEHPEEAAEILAEASKLPLPVAKKVLVERNDFSDPVPGEVHEQLLHKLAPILRSERIVSDRVDVDRAADELLEPAFAREALEASAPVAHATDDATTTAEIDA